MCQVLPNKAPWSRAFTPTHDDTCSHSWIAHWALPLAGGIGHHTARGASAGRLHAGSPTTHHRVAAPRPPLTSGHDYHHTTIPPYALSAGFSQGGRVGLKCASQRRGVEDESSPRKATSIRSAPACPIRKSSAACRSAQLRLLAPLRSASHRVHRSRAALSADAPPTRSFAAPRNPAPGTRAARASRTLRVRRPRHTCHAAACRRSARDPRRKQVARSRAFTPTHEHTCSHSC